MNQPPVIELLRALETLTRISEEQSRSLAESRDRAARVERAFRERMDLALSGRERRDEDPAESPLDPSAFTNLDRMRRDAELRQLRERAFLDAHQALMQMSAEESTRNEAQQIFELLRLIREIDADPDLLTFETPSFLQHDASADTKKREGDRLRSFLSFQEEMSSRLRERRRHWDELIERSDALLGEALKRAQDLAASSR